ncbi:MAG: hypothetical protein IPK06_18055 [Ignavibacteriae bacterium]|nr:hypothetical protein [Ignavibacteriota bacterium]
MNNSLRKYLIWSPRILTILFALFLSIFALDVFNEGSDFFETILKLAVHLIPSFLILISLLIAWKHEIFGGLIFILFSVFYILMSWGKFPFSVYLIICLPMLIISLLYFISWRINPKV